MRLHAAFADAFHAPLRDGVDDPSRRVFPEFIELVANMAAPAVLELGARNVTGASYRHHFPDAGRYIGCDIHPGQGVDLVGDVHSLSTLIASGSIDAIFSVSVFEHLVYPWKAVLEINRVLKIGGYVFISTHPTWPAHELPWDFWRFPVAGLAHLFVAGTGFEVVRAAEGLPARIYSLVSDKPTRGLGEVNLSVALIARKIGDYDADKLRWDLNIGATLQSEYPRPS